MDFMRSWPRFFLVPNQEKLKKIVFCDNHGETSIRLDTYLWGYTTHSNISHMFNLKFIIIFRWKINTFFQGLSNPNKTLIFLNKTFPYYHLGYYRKRKWTIKCFEMIIILHISASHLYRINIENNNLTPWTNINELKQKYRCKLCNLTLQGLLSLIYTFLLLFLDLWK